MKQILLFSFLIAGMVSVRAQTNTFPTTGNVGIGTTTPASTLHINPPLDAVSAIKIGYPGTTGNINVPLYSSPGGYNIDFYSFRDIVPDQIGARIRAERINTYQENNALIQAMDLSFFTSNSGFQTQLTEKMRISHSGNIGIGITQPKARLDLAGGIMIQSLLSNQSLRPAVSPSAIPGEIRAYSYASAGADDGFLRISAGAGSNPNVMSYIDISSYSTVPDMDKNIVFGTSGSEKVRISHSGNVGIGTSNPTEKLSVNGKIRAKEIKVESTNWPDYVFAKDYLLPSLQETEKQIKESGHLPGIPSAAEVEKNGIALGEMNKKLLQKIEELTLYLIEKEKKWEKEMIELKATDKKLKSQLTSLSDQIEILKSKRK